MSPDRRDFLTLGLTGLGGLLLVPPLRGIPLTASAQRPTGAAASPMTPMAAVFQDMAYTNVHGNGERYRAPARNSATVAYVNSLSEEELLRRHWFC